MHPIKPDFARLWPTRASPRWINPLLGLVLLVICSIVCFGLIEARRSDHQRASAEASNISAAISQDISRNLELFDLSIRGALESVGNPSVMDAERELRQLILFDRAATAAYVGQILVLDSNGDIIADSRSSTPKPANHSDRDYFRIHAQRPDFGLFVSRPLIARLDGEPVIALSRRITRPDGSFGGVVVGTVRLEYFHQLFRQMKLGPGGSLTLFRKDGTLLMREPYDPTQIGAKIDPPFLFDLASRAVQGEYEARSSIDGVDRLYHFHRIADLPLVQNVGLGIDDIYAQWRRRTLIAVLALSLCCAIIAALTFSLGRELRRRAEAERALRNMADRDSLTGLANRRCFDRTLALEWSRAAREKQPVSLLMIDADQFKLFNDTLGHAAGDVALIQLGRCLREGVHRPADLPARYGGEEFAVLLPMTEGQGALGVAEAIRTAVHALDIPHPKAAGGRFTISIGVACLIPNRDELPTKLIETADEALYASKHAGRNQSTWKRKPERQFKLAS